MLLLPKRRLKPENFHYLKKWMGASYLSPTFVKVASLAHG
jgi:hypothetical protein